MSKSRLYTHQELEDKGQVESEFENAYEEIRSILTGQLEALKEGATAGAAGAASNELWKTNGHATLPDGVVLQA